MTGIVEFYFDFSSPYGYFASHKIDQLAEKAGRKAAWKPVMIGAAFKETGTKPLGHIPLKGDYCIHDWERLARYMEVPWKLPDPFPVTALAPSRAYYWLADRDEDQARLFARAVFAAYFGEGRDISNTEMLADLASSLYADKDELLSALGEPAVKERLRAETQAAIERGVFGSPFIFVDGEPFWGSDRLWMVKKWLETGGW